MGGCQEKSRHESFKKIGISYALDGTEDKAAYERNDSSSDTEEELLLNVFGNLEQDDE